VKTGNIKIYRENWLSLNENDGIHVENIKH